MRDKTLRTIGATAVLVGVALAGLAQTRGDEPGKVELAAALDSAGSTSATTALSTSETTSTTTTVPLPYRIGLLSNVTTANYWEFIGAKPSAWNSYVLGLTKSALYGVDPVTGDLVPDLAVGAPPDPTSDGDGWWVEVPMTPDRTWSDGSPITATDVVYTFHVVRRLGLGGGWADSFPSQIEDVERSPDGLLRIEFADRPSLSVWPYGAGLAPIMSSKAWGPYTGALTDESELYAFDGSQGVSGGPVTIQTMTDTEITGIADGGGIEVTYSVFPDEASAVAALAKGDIDTILTPNGLSRESVDVLSTTPNVALETSPANSVRYLGFNLRRDPMSSLAFRQAVALVVDRSEITQALVPGATPALSMLSPFNAKWYDADRAQGIVDYGDGSLAERVGRAMTLLEGEGYTWTTPPTVEGGTVTPGSGLAKDGQTPAPLTILTPGDEYDPDRVDYADAIEQALEWLGFDVRTVVTDFDTVVDLAFTDTEDGSRQFDMYLLGWTLGNPALPDFYGQLFATDAPANSTGYSDAEFDSTLTSFRDAVSVDDAVALLWQMEKRLSETLPYLVLYHPSIVEAYRSDKVGFGIHGSLGGLQARLGGIEDVTTAP
ncbi:MAG: ABC transporter substrate-binding protein [Acidimicrobiia bacterium]